MIDLYTKGVLTIIAGALVILVIQNATTPARALTDACSKLLPCHVVIAKLPVQVTGVVETLPYEPLAKPKAGRQH